MGIGRTKVALVVLALDGITHNLSATNSMWRRNPPPFDDNNHRREGARQGRLKHNRMIGGLGMLGHRSKGLVVRMTQGSHMVTHHQDKFIPQFGQRTTL